MEAVGVQMASVLIRYFKKGTHAEEKGRQNANATLTGYALSGQAYFIRREVNRLV